MPDQYTWNIHERERWEGHLSTAAKISKKKREIWEGVREKREKGEILDSPCQILERERERACLAPCTPPTEANLTID